MATELIVNQTVGGNVDFGPYSIETIDIEDLKVTLDGVLQTLTTEYTVDEATSTVTFVTAPDVGQVVRIFRETPVDAAKAVLSPGSSIRAQNLNDNTEQALFAIQEIKDQYVTKSSGEFVTNIDLNENRITNLADPVDQQDAVTKQYLEDNYFDDGTETILSSEAWPDNDTTIATTASIDNRIDSKIDSAITGDIGTDGTGITVNNDGDGTITLSIEAGDIGFDRINPTDIITNAEQDAGSPAPADTNLFTSSAAARRFDTLVQTGTPTGSAWETGKTWYQNDEDKTVYVWDGDSWEAVTSGGAFTRLDQVIYVDATNGDDANNGHRISTPKRTIAAALNDINNDSTYGDGSTVVVAPGIYAEEFPIDIEKNDVSIVGTSLRNCIIHPAIPAADQAGYDVDVPEANELETMFRVNSGTYIANLTLMGMKASGARGGNALDGDSTYGLPTNQGWNFAFYPGATIRKSPYIQNCTNFSDSQINNVTFNPHVPSEGAAGDLDSAPSGGGILVNGATVDAASPLRSMVCDSYTHTALDGPGIFVTNNGYCQATSSYSFFNHYHLKCLNGGQANLAASTTDFGRYALIADGRSPSAIITAEVNGGKSAGQTTFNVDNLTDNWFGSATRPQDNMLVEIGSDVYPVISAVAVAGGWTVEISRPNTNDRTQNLGLINTINDGDAVSFYLRSMIASSGHTMEYVGSGTNYTALPSNGGVPDDSNQLTELNDGKIWAATTDHNGTFKVGGTFEVNQQTGFVDIPGGALSVNKLLDTLDTNNNPIQNDSGTSVDINDDLQIQGGNTLLFADDDNSNTLGFTAPSNITANVTFTLPDGDGNPGEVLSTDGSGTLSWSSSSAVVDRIIEGDTSIVAEDTGSNGSLTFTTDGSTAMTIDNSQNVGVGTTSPAGTLNVQGSTAAPALTYDTANIANFDAGTIQLALGIHNAAPFGAYLQGRDTGDGSRVISLNPAGGNVGIGTTSPAEAFEVQSASNTTIRIDNEDDSTAQLYFHNTGSTDMDISVSSANMTFNHGASERLRIDSSGRVGIGTSSPSTDLHVSKAASAEIRVSGTANGSDATIGLFGTHSGGGSRNISLKYDNSSDTYKLITTTANHITIDNSSGEVMRIDGSGRVGIGTTSPGDYSGASTQLSIASTGNSGLNIVSGTSSTGIIRFADGTTGDAAYRGRVEYMHDVDALMFGTAGTERARIDSSGRLLVGTSTGRSNWNDSGIETKIQIEGAGNDDSAALTIVANSGTTSSDKRTGLLVLGRTRGTTIGSNTAVVQDDAVGMIEFKGSDGTNFTTAATIKAQVDGSIGTDDMPGRLVFSTTADGASSPTERFRISSAGGWGIEGANYGEVGQVLKSNANDAPEWASPATTTAVQQTNAGTEDEYFFTNIPTWVNVIVINFHNVSLDVNNDIRVRLGSNGTYYGSNYRSMSSNGPQSAYAYRTDSFVIDSVGASNVINGNMVLTNMRRRTASQSGYWTQNHNLMVTNTGGGCRNGGGSFSNAVGNGDIDCIRIYASENTTDFDGGRISLTYY